MKLRTTSKSVRLRLSQTDVRDLGENGFVEDVLAVRGTGGEAFSYRLVRSESENQVCVSYENNRLTVSLPAAAADKWCNSEDVGIEAFQQIGGSGKLSILVEKDFACLTPRAGDEDKDTFPNPAGPDKKC